MGGFWKILELEPTRDISAIKRAYAQKTRIYHPEENPEGFLELRKAYQAAMDYAEQNSESQTAANQDSESMMGSNQGSESQTGSNQESESQTGLNQGSELQTAADQSSELQTGSNHGSGLQTGSNHGGESLTGSNQEQEESEGDPDKEPAGWFVSDELSGAGPNPFRDGEAIRHFVDLYTGTQRRNLMLWMDYFTSDAFLDAAWDSRFTALLLEKVTEVERDFPLNREFMMWLGIAYQFSIKKELVLDQERFREEKRIELNQGADFEGMESIRCIAYKGPLPKRLGGDELAVLESFKDYRHLIRLAESGSWNQQAMEEFKWIVDRYTSAYIKERCDPKGKPDYQRHPVGLRVFIHFFKRCDLPEELYRIVWQKYDLKSAGMGRMKIFYGTLRELVLERIPGILGEMPENFFQLNQERAACFARIQANPGREEEELAAFFAREDVQNALRSRRFVEEQLLSCSNWLNSLTPEGVVRWLKEFYSENQDIFGWDRVVEQAKRELEYRTREQKGKEEAECAAPEELDLSLLLAMPERVYAQPLTGPECVFKPDKEPGTEPLTKEGLIALFDRFAGGELTRLQLEFYQTTLVLTRDEDKYACFCFEEGYDTWYSMLSLPEVYRTVDSKDVEYLPFGLGKLAIYNIYEDPASILRSLNLVFMQIGRGRIQVRVGDCWLWSSHTSLQNSQFKKRMAMQKLAKIPAGRDDGYILSKFVFSQHPVWVESVSLSGERILTRLGPGSYDLAAAALAHFFQQKLAKLRLSWEPKGLKGGADKRHIILLQDGGQFMMAWLQDGRERAVFYASDAPRVFSGRIYPACLVHQDLNRIRNCLDLILDDMACAELVTGQTGEFVPVDRPYIQVREELMSEKA